MPGVVDWVVPGHAEVVTNAYRAQQRTNLLDWASTVTDAVVKGWPRAEIERIGSPTAARST